MEGSGGDLVSGISRHLSGGHRKGTKTKWSLSCEFLVLMSVQLLSLFSGSWRRVTE